MSELCKPTGSDDYKYDKYAVEDAARTLMRAEEIRSDKKMMELVVPHLKKQQGAITSVMQLRKLSNKKHMEESESKAEQAEEAKE